jgi:homoserine acetyltransferase
VKTWFQAFAFSNATCTATLWRLTHRTLVVGITSDVLYPYELQTELAEHMPQAELYAIDSPHGHDAFLIEISALNEAGLYKLELS